MPKVVKLGEFRGERKTGETIEYVVQTAPMEMAEEVVEHMTTFFLPREPMCMSRIYGDPEATELLRGLWFKSVQGGTTLIALLKENGQITNKLIGVNVTPIVEKNSGDDKKVENQNFKEVLDALIYIAETGNVYEKYGVDRYMTGYGLSVDSAYHGYNIGQRILECRRPLCERLGIKVTGTVFTAESSQKQAKKVGFELLYEEDYKTFELNGIKTFGMLPGKFQMMALKF